MFRVFNVLFISIMILLLNGCDNPLENRVNDLEDELENQKTLQADQDKLISSLLEQLLNQQSIIDSLNKKQIEYTDSMQSEQIKNMDSLNKDLTEYIDNLILSQNEIIGILVDSQPETSNDYIRIDSLQICWGTTTIQNSGEEVDFSISFSEPPKVFITDLTLAGGQIYSFRLNYVTLTSFKIFVTSTGQRIFNYYAIGKWM